MKDFDDMTPAEREAWFAERLQVQHDDTREDEADERLWIGLGLIVVIVAAVLGLNEWLRTMGYGA